MKRADTAAFLEMLMKGRVTRRVEDLDDDTLEAIAGSTVGPEHADLDGLIKDWTP
jgi:hypothetical protein